MTDLSGHMHMILRDEFDSISLPTLLAVCEMEVTND